MIAHANGTIDTTTIVRWCRVLVLIDLQFLKKGHLTLIAFAVASALIIALR